MTRRLTDREISAYQQDGVALIKAAIDKSWLVALDAVVDAQLKSPSRWVNDANPGAATNRLFTDRYLWRDNATVRDYVFNSGCAEIAAQAMESRQVRFYFDHLLVKEPRTEAPTPWHQDVPYWPFLGKQICSVWVALTDATVAGSAMEFVRGSHLDDLLYMPEQFGARDDHPADWTLQGVGKPVPAIEDHRSEFDIVGWDVSRGDALVFSAWLLHGAQGNASSDRRRAAISTRWLGDDAVWHPHAGADPTVTIDDVSVAPGELAHDDDRFPVVWPR